MALPNPICPMQSVPSADQPPKEGKLGLFAKSWWLYFNDMTTAIRALLAFPRYADLVFYYPDPLTVTVALIPTYPAPPQKRVGPYMFSVWLFDNPTGSNVDINMWRGDSGTIPGGKMASFTILDGLPLPLSITYYDDENYTIPGSIIYAEVTAIGSITPGGRMRILARVEGVS